MRWAGLGTLTPVLVPDLRPLSVGEIIDVAIKIWRRHLPTLARIVFVVVAPVQVLSGLVAASVRPIDTGNPSVDTHAVAGWVAGMITAQALSALAFLIASAAVLRAVSVAYLGGEPEWRDSLRAATARLRSLIWLGFLMGGGLFFAALALFIPFIWLGVAWSVAFPVLIAEGQRGTGALRRAFHLVRGRWWPTFGALLLAFMFQFFLGLVLGIPLGILTANSNTGSTLAIVLTSLVSIVSSVITTPFMAAVLVLIYFDLRVRKEGFDLELLSQGVGIPGVAPPAGGPWVAPGDWAGSAGPWGGAGGSWGGSGGWPAPSGGWPAPSTGPGSAPAPSPPAPPSPPVPTVSPPPGSPWEWNEPIDPTGGWGRPSAPDEQPDDRPAAGEPPDHS